MGVAAFNAFAFSLLACHYAESGSASALLEELWCLVATRSCAYCVESWNEVPFLPGKVSSPSGNLEQKCVQVSDLLSVVTLLTVEMNVLMMAFPKSSVFEMIHKEFAVTLLAFVVLPSVPHYTSTGEMHSVNSSTKVFPLTWFSAFIPWWNDKWKDVTNQHCLSMIDLKVNPQSQMVLQNSAWKDWFFGAVMPLSDFFFFF